MDAKLLKELVVYEPESGLLRWKFDHKTIRWIRAGSEVGAGSRKNGYRCTSINNKQYYQHRLVWLYVYGEWPKYQVDHINGDKADNRIENLRLATPSQNQHNRKKTKNKDGMTGAYKSTRCGTWYSTIMVGNKKHYLGAFKTQEDAAKAYANAKMELHPFNPDLPKR